MLYEPMDIQLMMVYDWLMVKLVSMELYFLNRCHLKWYNMTVSFVYIEGITHKVDNLLWERNGWSNKRGVYIDAGNSDIDSLIDAAETK